MKGVYRFLDGLRKYLLGLEIGTPETARHKTGTRFRLASFGYSSNIAFVAGPRFSFHDWIPTHNTRTLLCSSFKAGDRGPPY
jgi:hypothetical protein